MKLQLGKPVDLWDGLAEGITVRSQKGISAKLNRSLWENLGNGYRRDPIATIITPLRAGPRRWTA